MESSRDYGGSLLASFASWIPESSLWKMCQGSLFGDSEPYLETWPISGSMRSGVVCERQTVERPISEGACSSSPHDATYPTPSATPYGSSGNGTGSNVESRGRPSLDRMARTGRWPTPTAWDHKGPNPNKRQGGPDLPSAIEVGKLNPAWVEWLMGFPEGWTDLDR